jgi:hypothetical protein
MGRKMRRKWDGKRLLFGVRGDGKLKRVGSYGVRYMG